MTRAGGWATRAALPAAVLVVAGGLLAGCGASPKHVGPKGVDELTVPTPSPDPADFTGHAENVWFPLEPGSHWTYREYLPTGYRTLAVAVLPGTRTVDGIATTAVRWQVHHRRADRTAMVRWYAVDTAGNVWWFGQRVAARSPRLDPLAPHSWRAGVAGAEAGLLLTATPRLGDGYLNASQPGVVESRSTVESLDATVATPSRTYRHTVATRGLSTLAPLHIVLTYYARGLGMVAQQDTKSVSTSLSLRRFTAR